MLETLEEFVHFIIQRNAKGKKLKIASKQKIGEKKKRKNRISSRYFATTLRH